MDISNRNTVSIRHLEKLTCTAPDASGALEAYMACWSVCNGMPWALVHLMASVIHWESPMLECNGCNGDPGGSPCSSPSWHIWAYGLILLVPWFQVYVGDAESDRPNQGTKVCFSDMQ